MARYRLTNWQKRTIFELRRRGEPWSIVALIVGCREEAARKMVSRAGGCAPRERAGRPGCLTIDDREVIMLGLRASSTFSAIAVELQRSVSTISREVQANGGRRGYRAQAAQRRACTRALRSNRESKLTRNPRLGAYVEEKLLLRWSPQQISRRLRVDHPSDSEMRVSHETIYLALFMQSKGLLRKELSACLRSGRARRKLHGNASDRTRIADMIMISDRPAEIEDRAVPGHWEGDLIIGKNSGSAIVTLVERQTRYVMLARLEDDHRAETVRNAIAAQIQTLPQALRQSLTWDQGIEMAQHVKFTIDTGVAVYFCDPHSPWQRGTNENTNGLLRQYFPKGQDLSIHDQSELDRVAHELNGRPRATLNYATPAEQFAELFALTA